MSDSLQPHRLCSPWNSPSQNPGVGSLSLLQWIFPTQESNQGLLHCRQILYQLSYEGSSFRMRLLNYQTVKKKKKRQEETLNVDPVFYGHLKSSSGPAGLQLVLP